MSNAVQSILIFLGLFVALPTVIVGPMVFEVVQEDRMNAAACEVRGGHHYRFAGCAMPDGRVLESRDLNTLEVQEK